MALIACSDHARVVTQGGGAGTLADSDDSHHALLATDRFTWEAAPPVFPPGAQIAVLDGDPGRAGEIFTVRLRFPNGYVLPPYVNATDEHVTVIRGAFLAGMGRTFSKDSLEPFKAGDFVTLPANVAHFASTLGLTEVQIHAVGPFALTFVNPADELTKQ